MAVSQARLPSSIDLSGLPPRVAEAVAQMTAVCHQQLGSERSPGAFEEIERQVRGSNGNCLGRSEATIRE